MIKPQIYVPEKVRPLIENEPEFIELEKEYGDLINSFSSLIEYENKIQTMDKTKPNNIISTLIEKHVPEYFIPWRYLIGEGDKSKLPNLIYRENNIDIRAIYLDVYADTGLQDTNDESNLGIYMELISLYRTCKDKYSLSLFTHIKYLRAFLKVFKPKFTDLMNEYRFNRQWVHPKDIYTYNNAFTELLNPKLKGDISEMMHLDLGEYTDCSVGIFASLVSMMEVNEYYYEKIIRYQNAMFEKYDIHHILNAFTYYDKDNIMWYFIILHKILEYDLKLKDHIKLPERDMHYLLKFE